jgi:hypothetical protein
MKQCDGPCREIRCCMAVCSAFALQGLEHNSHCREADVEIHGDCASVVRDAYKP